MTEKKKQERVIQSNYIPYDVESGIIEWEEGVQGGESCRVDELKDIFAWMRGFVNGWYGWSSDGKGSLIDFLQVLKAKSDGWKICSYKQEDMDSVIVKDGKKRNVHIKANRIYKNLAWSLTGKTWNKEFALQNRCSRMTLDEEQEALAFITKHFFVIYPKDRKYTALLDEFMYMFEYYGIDCFNIDPWNAVKLSDNERGDERLIEAFFCIKEFSLKTNSVFNIVNHARSMTEQKEGKGKDAPYKVVNQFMQLGGSAWDIKMDGQYSIYRQERHLDPRDTKVTLFNLKQRQAEVVGVDKGEYSKIVFDRVKKQYYFDGVCPMDGSMSKEKAQAVAQSPLVFAEPLHKLRPLKPNEAPF